MLSRNRTAHAEIQYLSAALVLFTRFATAAGPSLVSTGTNGDQFSNWQITFVTEKYAPICGNSWIASESDLRTNNPECEQAFSIFNGTTNPYQIFDTTGTPTSTEDIAKGQEHCYCLTLLQDDGVSVVLMCFLIGGDGEVVHDGDTAKGVMDNQPLTDKEPLPRCKDLDIVVQSSTQVEYAHLFQRQESPE